MNRTINLQITGMHCQSCEMLIKDELSALPGIKEVMVDYKTGKGTIVATNRQISDSALIDAIKMLGIKVWLFSQTT